MTECNNQHQVLANESRKLIELTSEKELRSRRLVAAWLAMRRQRQ